MNWNNAMEFPISARMPPPPLTATEGQRPLRSQAQVTVLPAPLSVDEARAAAEIAREPREKTAIIRALLAELPASAAALNLATQIARQAAAASLGYDTARASVKADPDPQS